MEKILLLDGSSLLHRAFYALPPLSNHQGEYTNGVYIFMRMLMRLVRERHPDYLVVCFDKGRTTFRNQFFPEYKGTRQESEKRKAFGDCRKA